MAKTIESEILNFSKPFVIGTKHSAIKYDVNDIYNHLRFHIDGYKFQEGKIDNPYFDKLITNRRPNESDEILKYRKENYLPKTKQPCFKVLNSLKKIVKSQDWKIDYSDAEEPKKVGEDTLKQYCEKDYPMFQSLENWMYSLAIKEVIADPNGLIYVEPKTWDVPNGEKFEPCAKFVKTPNVLAYKYDEYALFKSEHVNTITDSSGTKRDLPVYIYMAPGVFAYVKEVSLDRNLEVELKSTELDGMYCFKNGGVLKDVVNGEAIYNSFIDPMLPSLDAVAGESSDLQAEVVQNIFSTFWYYSGNDCSHCSGTGKVNKNGERTICPKCEGQGRMLKSPFKDMVIGRNGLGENGIPTPPGGYIQKTTDIVSLQDSRIGNHIYDALGSINMEFLAQVPLNQSGAAKEVDRDELNNFVYGIAYHVVENVLNPIYKMINNMRYGVVISDEKTRNAMLPTIAVPEKYDLLSTNKLLEDFQKATESGIDNSIRDEYEVDIVNKIFSGQPETRDKLLLIKELDPLRGIGEDDKIQLFNTGITTKTDYIISTYISVFIDKLIASNPEYPQLDVDKQFAELKKLAEEKEKELDAANKVMDSILQPEPPQPNEDEPNEDE